ncbi:non-homologous end-joining DNA ligase [Sciscionella marina]|uniref:non-homologous end-joining DNA ligase n=1 Tax=Sciscionella marina TaxID=508770 RepID=UPI0003712928|nr:non-homologous end-joining DNA ligase [Sciscionella marina]
MSKETVKAGARRIPISKADKVLFPEDSITKADLVGYYRDIASTFLRHARGRPVAAERYPDGIDQPRIFQKNVPEHYPEWVPRVEVGKKEGGVTVHAVCDDTQTLVYLADQACVTPHLWLSRTDELDRPDRLIFDLDPPGTDLPMLRSAARSVRTILDEIGLPAFLMATGSRGFHVLTPLRRTQTFDQAREFARRLATLLAERHPDMLTVQQRKQDRGDRILVDYLRNSYAQTAVAPYAVRARPNAPVATPLDWNEFDTTTPWQYTIHTLPDRLKDRGDPWSSLRNRARTLTEPRRELEQLIGQ